VLIVTKAVQKIFQKKKRLAFCSIIFFLAHVVWHTVEEAAICDEEVCEEEANKDNEVPEPSSKHIKAKAKSLKVS